MIPHFGEDKVRMKYIEDTMSPFSRSIFHKIRYQQLTHSKLLFLSYDTHFLLLHLSSHAVI